MDTLFSSNDLAGISLRNRFVRSATFEGMADETGLVKPELIENVKELAQGGIGLIITGHTYYSDIGKASRWKVAIDSDDCISGLHKMTVAAHTNGSKIILQLGHAGALADPKLINTMPLGPSVIPDKNGNILCRKMEYEDIEHLLTQIANGAKRAKKAGFDGVQIHAAHGYLFSQFLSPYFNFRDDKYGGDTAGRTRILIEAIHSIKNVTGKNYPVIVKINSDDFIDGGINNDEMIAIAKILEANGIDAIELSGGTSFSKEGYDPVRKSANGVPNGNAYYQRAAKKLKKEVKTPIILVGGIRSLETARTIISSNSADYIAMSRPFIRNPDLISMWSAKIQDCSECLSCNTCFRPVLTGRGLYCPQMKKVKSTAI
jgi:2,4-dienoyl-CoA reductase-like NADH-dependent reductase (Old Yellow Enzyme family)